MTPAERKAARDLSDRRFPYAIVGDRQLFVGELLTKALDALDELDKLLAECDERLALGDEYVEGSKDEATTNQLPVIDSHREDIAATRAKIRAIIAPVREDRA